jgi:acetyltransferase-like isoleucine patch superfamily enzyme
MGLLKRLLFQVRLLFAGEHEKPAIYAGAFGVKFGKNVRITGKPIFGSEPYLIEIGDDVTITNGVVFHTHDGGVGIFRKEYPGINVLGKICVGNNVFIGSNSIILPNVTIGDNVVIGSGSIVSRSIVSNSLAVGTPAKVIKTIEEYKSGVLEKCIFIKEEDSAKRKEIILSLYN